ncbi:hypothetical protein [Methylorubrum extorquens]|uniref:hypothetical protein n=1 Tax=Methylorubrum extorquens TaxID=408 RepID=UPI0022382A47|nr:hypothetical protein [Methylorubrum extorquens]UYW28413.1 hypothetical protein OKC48_07830 [Methylorubrum extorquens]UYW31872.1 hypothetical protein OKB92_23350 [Methylorubrum extorquens]
MGESEAFVLEARPLSLEEFQSLCRLSQKYRDADAGPKAIIRSKLAALVLLALIITCAILYNFEVYIEYPSIFGGGDRFFVLNGSWILMLALYAFLLGVLMHAAGCAASGAQAIETEWSARLRLSWTETRIDHRGVTVEGPAAAVFQAWSTMTEVRSEAGLIAFVTNGVILLAVPEAVISTEERDRVVAYCAARIAEAR